MAGESGRHSFISMTKPGFFILYGIRKPGYFYFSAMLSVIYFLDTSMLSLLSLKYPFSTKDMIRLTLTPV
ncbi:hypothetical protein M2444_001876 [Paenibacillus sp. PastF-3]|nr:hypothetical protein [Paenibacillus sp. PastF-3]